MNYWIRDFRGELLETSRSGTSCSSTTARRACFPASTTCARAAAKILAMGPRTLVVKRGEYGAILFHGCHFMAPGYLLEDVFDPTGAGDCFAGGFIGYLAERGLDSQEGDIELRNSGAP